MYATTKINMFKYLNYFSGFFLFVTVRFHFFLFNILLCLHLFLFWYHKTTCFKKKLTSLHDWTNGCDWFTTVWHNIQYIGEKIIYFACLLALFVCLFVCLLALLHKQTRQSFDTSESLWNKHQESAFKKWFVTGLFE